jgi:hypothetical protein
MPYPSVAGVNMLDKKVWIMEGCEFLRTFSQLGLGQGCEDGVSLEL